MIVKPIRDVLQHRALDDEDTVLQKGPRPCRPIHMRNLLGCLRLGCLKIAYVLKEINYEITLN